MTRNDSTSDSDGELPISRRGFVRAWGVAGALAAAGAGVPAAAAETPELNRIWTGVLSNLPDNWGRWGDDDQVGALNYLGEEEAFAGLRAAMRGGPNLEVFPLQLPYTGKTIGEGHPVGDPVFPTRQPARRDNVVDARHYREGGAEPLPGGMKFADDAFVTRLFLQGSTQYDALSHVWYDRVVDEDGTREPLLYNGFPAETTATRTDYAEGIPGLRPANPLREPFSTDLRLEQISETWGSSAVDIANAADVGSVGRGVLLDVGRHKKDEPPYRLDPAECVTLDDLTATAEAQGVELRKRDILLVRTGSVERARDPDAEHVWGTGGPEDLNEPGLCFSQDLVEFFADMEIPVVGADNLAVEKLTTQTIDVREDLHEDVRSEVDFGGRERLDVVNPLHPALITNLGMIVCEILYLQDLAAACAADGVYDFLYVAAPLNIEGGAGAPVNPVVVKASRPEAANGRFGDGDGERGGAAGD
ncbi:cyclase family protein [Halomarina pelagica]|uniref:cyclase family protein n=1 Tax=Halomarina pelagica TaxID=2961599 RepID=UPI0020C1DE60|nr:cyclase family protein [Halomarina sp. BND7]